MSEVDNMLQTIKKEVPYHFGGDKEKAIKYYMAVRNIVINDSNLLSCTPQSIYDSIMQCVKLDILPDKNLGLAYLIPRKDHGTDKCNFQLGYKGLIELARRSGIIRSFYADVVYRKEVEAGLFKVVGGSSPSIYHEYDVLRPELRNEKGEKVGAYASCYFIDGTTQSRFVDSAFIAKRKALCKFNGGPWSSWTEEMEKKTAIKALCKLLPMTANNKPLQIQEAIINEDKQYEATIKEDQEELQSENQQALESAVLGKDVAIQTKDLNNEKASV